MDLPSNPPVSPAVRITVLLRLASEGFQDAFGARPEWLEAPPVDLAELREVVGVERIGQLREATGLREGEGYAAGGPPGVVRLAAAAHEGVLGLLGVAALPPDVIIEQTAEGPRYHVPEDWFLTTPAGDPAATDGVLLLLTDGTQVPVTELPGTGPWTFLVLQPVPDLVGGPVPDPLRAGGRSRPARAAGVGRAAGGRGSSTWSTTWTRSGPGPGWAGRSWWDWGSWPRWPSGPRPTSPGPGGP